MLASKGVASILVTSRIYLGFGGKVRDAEQIVEFQILFCTPSVVDLIS